MKVIKKLRQHRRDCTVKLECENCGNVEIDDNAYDDWNYWNNVIPDRECTECGESTNSLDLDTEAPATKYPENKTV